jgi:hypothetical protein
MPDSGNYQKADRDGMTQALKNHEIMPSGIRKSENMQLSLSNLAALYILCLAIIKRQ